MKNAAALHFPEAVGILDWAHGARALRHAIRAARPGRTHRTLRPELRRALRQAIPDRLWQGDRDAALAALAGVRPALPGAGPIARVEETITYPRTQHAWLGAYAAWQEADYPVWQEAGYAVGSGLVERAVALVINRRMKRQGRRWRRANADAVVALRVRQLNADGEAVDDEDPHAPLAAWPSVLGRTAPCHFIDSGVALLYSLGMAGNARPRIGWRRPGQQQEERSMRATARRFGFHMGLAMVFLAGALALSACDLGGGGGGSASATATATVAGVPSADAHLKHEPTGTADLSWDSGNKTLTAKLNLTGLAPNSTHPAHIHSGACGSNGLAVHSFPDLKADGAGVLSATQTFDNVADGIPASGWYINVHNASGTDVYQTMDIACANITNSNTNTSQAQSAHVDFTRGYGPSQNASGGATLSIKDGKLMVTVNVSGLEPTSVHKAHVHTGSCESQGPVLYPLTDLRADGAGNATATTTIDSVSSIPSSGWYVNVHRGTNLDSPIDFDPIACGDVAPM